LVIGRRRRQLRGCGRLWRGPKARVPSASLDRGAIDGGVTDIWTASIVRMMPLAETLSGLPWLRRGGCANRPTHLLSIHAESEEGADEEVNGDAWVAGFHFGDAGLAGADEVGDLGLGVAEGPSSFAQKGREGEMELDVLDIFVGDIEEVLGRPHPPAGRFEAPSLCGFHRKASSKSRNRRTARVIADLGVLRLFFAKASAMTIASVSTR